MKTLLKSPFKRGRAWWLVLVLLGLICRPTLAQTSVVSDYPSFLTALNSGVSVITNFMTNTTISLTTAGQHINITHTVLIDGYTNGVVFDGGLLARVFTVATNAQLTLYNVQVINGTSTNGGAIYNAGTLIISNCIFAGNAATNVSGVAGTTNSNGNGGNGGSGATAEGGAIYSLGPVSIYNSIIGTNSCSGGNGASGGSGGPGVIFGGNGGNAGSGGSAYGAAVFSTGSKSVFFATDFLNNTCTAGSAGSSGSAGGGAFPGYGGAGASGGSAAGGAVYVEGPVFVTNCLFAQNTITAGASGSDGTGNNNGFNGGGAEGGGLYINARVTNAYLENTVFFGNTCTGGAGGSATAGSENGGNGGSAAGGGLVSAALRTTMRNCTLATNTLVAGAGASGTSATGSTGSTGGWDIYRLAGVVELSGSIISGGTNESPDPAPNVLGVTDAGYNISSDATLARAFGDTSLIDCTNADLDSGLADWGGPDIGPTNLLNPPAFLTLAIVDGSVATNFVPGVPGLTFPATDQLGNARGSPASAGAYELNPITIDTNAGPPIISSEPVNQQTGKGDTATFTVIAQSQDTNNPSLGYQWQLNGTNLTDNNIFMGSTSSNLTVKNVSAAQAGSYQVIVSVSLLEGATTSSPPASLIIVNPAKVTTQPVSKRDVPNGSVVSFSVAATGSPPLFYQWYWVSTDLVTNMLADSPEISGATNSTLTISPATTNNEGSYFVIVSDVFGTNSSVDAVLSIVRDTTKPAVAISLPALGARTNNLVVTGTATDNAQVVQVNYWVTNVNAGNNPARTTNSGSASIGTNGTTTKAWAISNVFLPGTNYVTVQSIDYTGNKSALVTREFFYKSPALFGLILNGPGTNSGTAAIAGDAKPANGAMLNIGEGYTLTALPAKGYVLSNWTSSTGAISNSPIFHFIMEPNLTNTANFTTNLFIGAAGTYNGLFYETNEVTELTAGMLKNLIVGSTGAYSGSLMLGGVPYSLISSFDTSGYASNYVKRTMEEGGPVAVEMTLNWTSGAITGSVSGSNSVAWISPLEAEKSAASLSSAEYTVLLEAGTNATGDIPPGFGYMLITNHHGTVTLSGALADGTAFNQTPPLGVLGDVPVYASLYGNTGLLLGWLGLSNDTVEAETPMAWIKPAARSGVYYAEGFTNYLMVTGSGWTNPPARMSAVSLTNGSLTISNTSLDLEFTISNTNNTLVKVSSATTNATNSVTGTIAPKTGLLTITFGNGTGRATTIGYGAILQDSTNGGGYFVTKTNAGAILLTP
jgi:hypothetical protein